MEVTRATVEEFLEMLRKDPELRERAREVIVAADWERVDRALERMAAEIAAFAAETRARISELEQTTNTRFDELTGRFEELREEMNERFVATDEKFDALRKEMGERFEQVDERFEQVDGRFEQVDGRFEQVDGRFEQMDRRFEQMDRRFEQVDERFERIEERLNKVEGELGNLSGRQIEDRLSHEPGKYLGRRYRRVKKLAIYELPEMEQAVEEGVLSEAEYEDVLRSDVVVRAMPREASAAERVVVVEASKVVDRGDVERARRRAAALARVWPGAEGLVFGYGITEGAKALAEASGVTVLVDRVVEEEAGAA